MEGLVPLPAALFAFPPDAGEQHYKYLPYLTTLHRIILIAPHDVLRRRLHVAGLYFKHRGGRGEGEPTLLFLGEVGRWETTGHCSLEIQRDTVHFGYPPLLAPPTSENWRRGGPAELDL